MTEVLREIPSPPGIGGRTAERLVLGALERVEGGTIELGPQRFGSGPPVRVEVLNRDVYRRLLWRPRMGLGESYVAGDWRADDLPRLFEILIHLQAVRLWLKRVPFFHKPPFVPGEGSVEP